MLLVDTHCHLDSERYDLDRDDVLMRAQAAGVARIIIPGIDINSSQRALQLADQHEMIYAAVGIHPNSIPDIQISLNKALDTIRQIAEHPKVVAIGEIGIDYHWDKMPHNVQHQWLRAQLNLATELKLPVILHDRESTSDILILLSQWRQTDNQDRPGVLHSFGGKWEDARVALEMGFYCGFTGPITYPKADETRRVALNTPEDRLLIETDGPYLSPQIYRGKRNEPAYVRYIAEKIAEMRGVPSEYIANRSTQNAMELFGLGMTH